MEHPQDGWNLTRNKNGSNCWCVDVGNKLTKNGCDTPLIQKCFHDKAHRGEESAKKQAITFGNKAHEQLVSIGLLLPKHLQHFKPRPKKSAVTGVLLHFPKYVKPQWRVAWSEASIGGKHRCNTITIKKALDLKPQFEKAVMLRRSKELTFHGKTKIDLAKIDQYFEKTITAYLAILSEENIKRLFDDI